MLPDEGVCCGKVSIFSLRAGDLFHFADEFAFNQAFETKAGDGGAAEAGIGVDVGHHVFVVNIDALATVFFTAAAEEQQGCGEQGKAAALGRDAAQTRNEKLDAAFDSGSLRLVETNSAAVNPQASDFEFTDDVKALLKESIFSLAQEAHSTRAATPIRVKTFFIYSRIISKCKNTKKNRYSIFFLYF